MKIYTEIPPLQDKLVSRFAAFETGLNGSAHGKLHELRRHAIEDFRRIGFPTLKNEDWKYTPIAHLLKTEWEEPIEEDTQPVRFKNNLTGCDLEAHILVFVNGKFRRDLSVIKQEKPGVKISSFETALKEDKALLEEYFGKSVSTDFNGWTALNTAFALEGAFVYVPEGVGLRHPIHLLYLNGSDEKKLLIQNRNLFILKENSSAIIIEEEKGIGSDYLFNTLSEIFAAQSAQLNHYKLQVDPNIKNSINLTQIAQQKSSLCNNYTITLGGKLVRNDLNFRLAEPHCETHLYGLYVTDGEQHVDNHTFVDHASPNCFSNEFYKGIAKGHSTAVFNGKVLVRQDAQKTNAYQSNKNLLLSSDAKINTKPQLEIFADDVKCSHGATTGQLDEEALFYLRSRGIGLDEAKAMLTYAFAEEVLENIKLEALKERLERELAEKLA
jgi:Fe-S cluster assembly protein SufD